MLAKVSQEAGSVARPAKRAGGPLLLISGKVDGVKNNWCQPSMPPPVFLMFFGDVFHRSWCLPVEGERGKDP